MFQIARLGFKGDFLSLSFHCKVSRSLKKQLLEKVKCHIGGGGGHKSSKKVSRIIE